MEKVIVEIVIPTLGRSFDFMLPVQNGAQETIAELVAIIARVHPEAQFVFPELYDCGQKRCLTQEASLVAAGVRDGSQLMLI